jgi:hypothetical protein
MQSGLEFRVHRIEFYIYLRYPTCSASLALAILGYSIMKHRNATVTTRIISVLIFFESIIELCQCDSIFLY